VRSWFQRWGWGTPVCPFSWPCSIHPSTLSTLYVFLILQFLKTGHRFLQQTATVKYHGLRSLEITFFSVKFPFAIYFYVPFISIQITYHLSWRFCPSDVCWLPLHPSHVMLLGCTLPVHLCLPHKSEVVNLILAKAKSEEGLIITEIKGVSYRLTLCNFPFII